MSAPYAIINGVEVHEDLNGYAVVMKNGKVIKKYTNSREDALGKAMHYAQEVK